MAKDIGSMIRELRKAAAMSQSRLADKIGVSYQQVQKYEKGASNLSVPRLMQIAEVFGVPPESFLYADTMERKMLDTSTASALSDIELIVIQLFRRLGRKHLKNAFIEILKNIVKIAEGK